MKGTQEAKLLFSFLALRRPEVKLNGMFTDCEIVNRIVLMEPVLEPLILLLYVNNFSSIINTTEKVIQFGDDASIVCCEKDRSLHGKVKKILQKSEEYVEMNKLTLNTKANYSFSGTIIPISDLFF